MTAVRKRADATLQLYGGAVALMREQIAGWQHGETASLSLPWRVAHSLAVTVDKRAFALASVLASGPRDDASRAVQTAMLAVSAAERVLRAPRELRHLALSALLVDAGRVRLAGVSGLDLDVFQQLPDALDTLAPASSAALGMDPSASTPSWAITAFEVAWLERPHLGPLYQEELEPQLASRLLWTVRTFLERVAPRTSAEPLSPLLALTSLDGDRSTRALLASAVGRPPAGTVVELETGQWAVVGPPSDRPLARVLTDEKGKAISGDWVELARSGAASPIRVVSPGEARFNVARAFFEDSTA